MLQEQPEMPISQIKVKDRARKKFDEGKLQELMASISRKGVQTPVVVALEEIDGKQETVLVAGGRRMMASLRLGRATIPYRWMKDCSAIERKRIELEENVVRDDLHWTEKNKLIAEIAEMEAKERGTARGDPTAFKMKELEEKTGEDVSTLTQRVRFHKEMEARPELAEKVRHMNMSAAMRQFEQLKVSQNIQQLAAQGKIITSEDYLLGDCTELIKKVKDESVQMLLSDTPFAIPDLEGDRGDNQQYTQQLNATDNLTREQMVTIINKMAPEWWRTLKPSGHIWLFFGWDVYEHLYQTLTLQGFIMERVPVIWDKGQTTGAFKGYAGAPCYEQIMIGHKPPRQRRFAEPFKNLLTIPKLFKPVPKDGRSHPFEKPVDLLSWMIKQSTNAGEIVMDNFAGTGASWEAAKQLGRSYIGHEIDKDHYWKGMDRRAKLDAKTKG